MVTKSRWLTLLAAALLAVVSGCAHMHGAPSELIERNDHAALAAWYERHAEHLRAHAEEMRQMAKGYKGRMTKPGPASELVRHCEQLTVRYTKAAEDADALARMHRELIGS